MLSISLSVLIIIYNMIIMVLFDQIKLQPNPVLTGVFVFIVGYQQTYIKNILMTMHWIIKLTQLHCNML